MTNPPLRPVESDPLAQRNPKNPHHRRLVLQGWISLRTRISSRQTCTFSSIRQRRNASCVSRFMRRGRPSTLAAIVPVISTANTQRIALAIATAKLAAAEKGSPPLRYPPPARAGLDFRDCPVGAPPRERTLNQPAATTCTPPFQPTSNQKCAKHPCRAVIRGPEDCPPDRGERRHVQHTSDGRSSPLMTL